MEMPTGRAILTVLVVDADSVHRQSMRNTLRTSGYRVLEAVDCRHAEHVLHQNQGQIDLLVTALSLPGGNGYELASRLVESEPKLKVLFVSGQTGATVKRYYDAPWAEVQTLTRPFEPEELFQRLKVILEADRRSAEAP